MASQSYGLEALQWFCDGGWYRLKMTDLRIDDVGLQPLTCHAMTQRVANGERGRLREKKQKERWEREVESERGEGNESDQPTHTYTPKGTARQRYAPPQHQYGQLRQPGPRPLTNHECRLLHV